MEGSNPEGASRDAASLRLLGAFFCILGTVLFIGTWWSLDDLRATVVSVASSAAILVVGVGMLLAARRLVRKASLDADDSNVESQGIEV